MPLVYTMQTALHLNAATNEGAKRSPANAITLGIFDSLDHHAEVYLCSLLKTEKSPDSDTEIERGIVTLHVVACLRGEARDTFILPYSFAVHGYVKDGGPLVWPRLNLLDGKKLLCVVVPGAEDPTAPTVQNINEAASMASIVGGNDDPQVEEMRAMCKLYETAEGPALVRDLGAAVNAPHSAAMRDFVLQEALMKLGRKSPEEALQILRSRIMTYKAGSDSGEAIRLIMYINQKAGTVEPWQQMSSLFIRALVSYFATASPELNDDALRTIAYIVSQWNDLPKDHRFENTLSKQEKQTLMEALEKSEPVIRGPNERAQFEILRKWLGQ
jgi:hypothetical protein